MSRFGWFGFRTVQRGSHLWHGFREGVEGERSLCGRVAFGRAFTPRKPARSCRRCAVIWGRKYPPRPPTPGSKLNLLLR